MGSQARIQAEAYLPVTNQANNPLSKVLSSYLKTRRLSRLLRILHSDMAGHAEWAQAHGPFPLLFPSKAPQKGPLWLEAHTAASINPRRGSHLGSVDSRVRNTRSVIPGACWLHVRATPCSAASSLRGREHSQRRPGRGALKQCSPV